MNITTYRGARAISRDEAASGIREALSGAPKVARLPQWASGALDKLPEGAASTIATGLAGAGLGGAAYGFTAARRSHESEKDFRSRRRRGVLAMALLGGGLGAAVPNLGKRLKKDTEAVYGEGGMLEKQLEKLERKKLEERREIYADLAEARKSFAGAGGAGGAMVGVTGALWGMPEATRKAVLSEIGEPGKYLGERAAKADHIKKLLDEAPGWDRPVGPEGNWTPRAPKVTKDSPIIKNPKGSRGGRGVPEPVKGRRWTTSQLHEQLRRHGVDYRRDARLRRGAAGLKRLASRGLGLGILGTAAGAGIAHFGAAGLGEAGPLEPAGARTGGGG